MTILHLDDYCLNLLAKAGMNLVELPVRSIDIPSTCLFSADTASGRRYILKITMPPEGYPLTHNEVLHVIRHEELHALVGRKWAEANNTPVIDLPVWREWVDRVLDRAGRPKLPPQALCGGKHDGTYRFEDSVCPECGQVVEGQS